MLIFTHIARVVSAFGLFFGPIFMAAALRSSDALSAIAAIQFNAGLAWLMASLAMGTLAEISLTLSRKP